MSQTPRRGVRDPPSFMLGDSMRPAGSPPPRLRSMTMWSGSFPPLNWHHHLQQGGGHVSHSHENVEPGHVHSGGTIPGGTYEHPALGPLVDELPPLPDEVIYRIAAILHQHSEDELGSKG
jgi:hypothetical protein